MNPTRRLLVGAEVQPGGGAHFRVWAPGRQRVEVVFPSPSRTLPLQPETDGYFSAMAADVRTGACYRIRLDGGEPLYPDPASRFQPDGPHGPSQIVDPSKFAWSDEVWPGVGRDNQVIYELHLGTFTPEGTWRSAEERLDHLADLGVTIIEVMPIAEFPGQFGWGYDGVDWFAPSHLYGTPDDFRHFVNRAHQLGLGMMLDVVYNHFGPSGNYWKLFSPTYFSDTYKNEWGEPINFDGPGSAGVREFVIANAGYWIDEFHIDGLRLDATQQIFDASPDNIITALTRRVRDAANGRQTIVVAENESQHTNLVRPTHRGGFGLDALWNDDFHHSARVALTGHREAYYSDYLGTPQELLSAVKWGYLFQGQYYSWQKQARGTPALDLIAQNFVNYLDNHDQVANSARGERIHQLTSPGRFRAMTAFLLLAPQTPMLFQGQEFAASAPFAYFADHEPDLAKAVSAGRKQFLSQFPSIASAGAAHEVSGQANPLTSCAVLAEPHDRTTFERCQLNWAECDRHRAIFQMHRDLIRLRRTDPVFRAPRPHGIDGAVIGPNAFVLRFFGEVSDRLTFVNLGHDLHLHIFSEPLIAPPDNRAWQLMWSTEDLCYGGNGTPPIVLENGWLIPGESAIVLTSSEVGL